MAPRRRCDPEPVRLLEEKGIKVCAVALPDSVSGVRVTVKRRQRGCPSSSSMRTTGERRRFRWRTSWGTLADIPKQIDPEPLCHRFAGPSSS
jgi:hypothetical protein